MAKSHSQLRGRRWEALRAQVLAEETRCWICGEAVDPTLPKTHPDAPQIDHIVPLSRGGPAMDRANLRLAHGRCNRSRSAAGASTPKSSRTW